MVKCVCINAKNMPFDYPNKNLWIVEKKEYHIERIIFITRSNILGVELAEIDLSQNMPYAYFRVDRFAIYDLDAFIALIKACKEEQDSDFDINAYIEKMQEEKELQEEEAILETL